MAQANPGESLAGVTTAGAGTAIQLATNVTPFALPTMISMVVTVASWAINYNLQAIAAYPYASVGLEVSMDSSNWVRIGVCQPNGNGQFKVAAAFPCLYARATLDALDTRITGGSFTAWVAGGS